MSSKPVFKALSLFIALQFVLVDALYAQVAPIRYQNVSIKATVVSFFDGYIQKLHSLSGDEVRKGDKVIELYSQNWIQVQKEHLHILELDSNSPLLALSRKKILNLGITQQVLQDFERKNRVDSNLILYAPDNGILELGAASQAMSQDRPGSSGNGMIQMKMRNSSNSNMQGMSTVEPGARVSIGQNLFSISHIPHSPE